jgi:hypothetical protein
MKITSDSIRHGFGQMKSFLQGGYARAHKFASGLDRFVDVSRRAYGVLAPYLGNAANQGAMKALGGYDDLKRRAIDVDTQGQQVVGRLRKVVPEIGF